MTDGTDLSREGPSLLFTAPGPRARLSRDATRLLALIILSAGDAVLSPEEAAFAADLTGSARDAMRELAEAGLVTGTRAGPGRVHVTVTLAAFR